MIKRYKCVVVANGLFPTGQQALELLRQAEFVVACDGAVIGLENGRLPDAVVGDLDSLPEPVRNRYSDRIHRVKDQETNDLTKAVNYVKTLGFREVLILTEKAPPFSKGGDRGEGLSKSAKRLCAAGATPRPEQRKRTDENERFR